MAYCLLGLFDINMPMLYGEGTKAFLRLQEEIIKQCPDMSLFAWLDTKIPSNIEYSGFLAHSPRLFAHAGSMVAKPELLLSRSDFSLTNRGIRFHTFVVDHDPSGVSLLPLGHRYASRNEILGVYMQQIGSDVFARKFPDMLAFADRIFTSGLKKGILENGDFSGQTSFLAPRKLSDGQAMRIPDTFLRLDSPEDLSENDRFLRYVEPSRCWAPKSRKLYGGFGGLFLGYFHFTPDWAELYDYYVVVVSFNMSKRERWRIALVKGKYWPKIMGGLHEYYQNRDDEFSTTQNITLSRGTSTYKNLRGSVRTIEVSCRLKNQDRLSASLCIEVVKSKERW